LTYAAAPTSAAPGVLAEDGQTIVDLQHLFADMLQVIDAGAEGLAAVRRCVEAPRKVAALPDVRLLAPIPQPRQIRDFGAYIEHMENGLQAIARLRARIDGKAPQPGQQTTATLDPIYAELPVHYISNRFNVVGPDAGIAWPNYTKFLDFELEIAMIVGRTGKNIPRDSAADHVFGYTLFNDFSARDHQQREMRGMLGPSKGKSFDTGNAFGPWIVTADELADVRNMDVAVDVNGERWASNTTKAMAHTFEDMIAYVSLDETLHAGEVFGSGTVAGCSGLEQDRWLADGDIISISASAIGTLTNRIIRTR
jgi:2-keto-4-pentenoate hydratase/2-oxohepta-3-ene-1,7-dioic acid hydratase in catechol pathway